MITGKTQLLGIIGNPVEHSLSPVMHNAAIAELGVNYVYIPMPVKPENLADAIKGFSAINLAGFNITIPHKQAILPFLSEVSPAAKAVGAVNTVWKTSNGWAGTNTDVEGFLAPLKTYDYNWQQTSAIVLGIGGAARAVVAGLSQLGIAEIHCIGRDANKLETFKESWQNIPLSTNLITHPWEQLKSLIPNCGLVVNTTPVGMYPKIEEIPLTPEIIQLLKPNTIAYDLIYTPNPTKFLKTAKQAGAIPIDGLEMLVQQGAAALQIWLKQSVSVDTMRASLKIALGLKN
ncbi:MAG TPA: shikimate dehydrogenase [Halomicronema sp.]